MPILYIRLPEPEAIELLSKLEALAAVRRQQARQDGKDVRGIGVSTVALEILFEELGINTTDVQRAAARLARQEHLANTRAAVKVAPSKIKK